MQEESMFLARLKKRYGWNLVFRVGIDTQEVLPFAEKGGTFAEVKDEIEIRVRDGCRILAPAHRVRNDVSVENLNNFIKAAQTSGVYACRSHPDGAGVRQFIGKEMNIMRSK
jgi:hypothetical protein